MTKHEFYILNDLYNGRQGRGGCTSDIDRTRALDDQAAINALTDAGLIDRDTGALTGAGFAAAGTLPGGQRGHSGGGRFHPIHPPLSGAAKGIVRGEG